MMLTLLAALVVPASSPLTADPRCALLIKLHSPIACEASPPSPPSARAAQPASRENTWQAAQQGQNHYPLAYGFSTGGWYSSTPTFGTAVAGSALMSFPYRYDQFYRGPRKVWW